MPLYRDGPWTAPARLRHTRGVANPVRLPITNVVAGGDFTGAVVVGGQAAPLHLLLDTGSSTLAVDGHRFDPSTAAETQTTNLVQTVQYGAGGWIGAVVRSTVSLDAAVSLRATPVAVTYGESPGMFGGADGILGLAYRALDRAYVLAGDTWAARPTAAEATASPTIELPPYFTQLEEAGVVHNRFAFAIARAAVSLATDDPASDPANHGVLVLGGGRELTDLYVGDFATLEVIHDVWYNTSLVAVQVGAAPPIAVAPLPAGDPLVSNAIIDSGTNVLLLEQALFDAVLAALGAIDPSFPGLLTAHAFGAAAGLPHDQLDLARWPTLTFTFQAPGGGTASVAVAPSAYWQADAGRRGEALAFVIGGGAGLGARSILGLPLFVGRYAVFDRALDGGVGVIELARRA